MLTSEFVTSVRRQGAIPSSVTDATLMSMGDEEIQARFIPLLEVIRQNYFVREITASPDARGRIPIPARAVGASLRNVQLSVGNAWFSLPLRALETADAIAAGSLPAAYYLDAGSICLLPNGSSGTLRIRYAARPGRMVLDTDTFSCKALFAVGIPGSTTTALTAGFLGSLASCDIASSGPAHQQKAMGITLCGSQPSLTVLNSDLIEQPIVGDFVTLSDRTPFVPLPEELFSALVHSVAANVLLAKGYLEESSAQEGKAGRCVQEAKGFLMPRNEGNPQVISGGLRRALNGRSRSWRW